jgi:hypothetical protein
MDSLVRSVGTLYNRILDRVEASLVQTLAQPTPADVRQLLGLSSRQSIRLFCMKLIGGLHPDKVSPLLTNAPMFLITRLIFNAATNCLEVDNYFSSLQNYTDQKERARDLEGLRLYTETPVLVPVVPHIDTSHPLCRRHASLLSQTQDWCDQ